MARFEKSDLMHPDQTTEPSLSPKPAVWQIESVHEFRKRIKVIAMHVRALMPVTDFPPTADTGEMCANIMLTYRHLEDAGMRLGKVIQAYDGGVSVYDKGEA